ncbi:MAG TPA: cation diffusion facilitator family transporter [Candidatus Competibacteraceae bacterium]|nr:cation diffusion facilitator family transporter [Candidatus Competibacteraceae bacterium]
MTRDARHRARLLHLATAASVATAVLLMLAKLVAWLLTDSIAVLASLVDSLMDAAASLINLLAVRYSLTPADAEHRFGHGKAEALAGLGQATFIAGSALFLLLQAGERLLHPQPLTAPGVGIAVMAFSIAATAALLVLQRHVVRRTRSTAIKADALHYASDLATNLSIILALVLAQFGLPGADPLFGLALGGYILYSAWSIGREAVNLLMDRELPEAVQHRILAVALSQPGVLGAHDLRTRQSGHTWFVQLHLELDGHLSLNRAHGIAERAIVAIRAEFPQAEVIIHQDPVDASQRPA